MERMRELRTNLFSPSKWKCQDTFVRDSREKSFDLNADVE